MKNTFIKMLSVMMAMVIALGACAITVYAEDCTHENKELISSTATCTKDGVGTYRCPDCGANDITEEILSCQSVYDAAHYNGAYKDDLEFDSELVEENRPATCVSGKCNVYVCLVCGDGYAEVEVNNLKNPDNHVGAGTDEWTAGGKVGDFWTKTQTCLCGATITENLNDEDHVWVVDTVVAPTDTENGSVAYKCEGTNCVTGCIATRSIDIFAEACEHENKGEGTLYGGACQPTFTVYDCADCGSYATEFVAAAEHVDSEGNIIDTACNSTLSDEGTDCVNCGEHFDREPHDYDEYVFEGDCQNAPYTTYTCACGYEYTDNGTLDPNAHKYETKTNDDCSKHNREEWEECSVCHDIKKEGIKYLYDDIYFSFKVKNSSGTNNDGENKYVFVNGASDASSSKVNKVQVEIYAQSYDNKAVHTMQFQFRYNTKAFETKGGNKFTANKALKDEIATNELSDTDEKTAGIINIVYAASPVIGTNNEWKKGVLQLSNTPTLIGTIELTIKDDYVKQGEVVKEADVGEILINDKLVIADVDHKSLEAKAANVPSIKVYLRGDISGTIGSELEGDGKINAIDLSYMIQLIAEDDYRDSRADVDLDGKITLKDYTLLRNWLLESITYPNTKK